MSDPQINQQTAPRYEPTVEQIKATYRIYLRAGLTPTQASMALLYALGLPRINDWRETPKE